MKMNKHDFYNVSIRGMVAYGIMCLENYVFESYPDRDFSTVLHLAWSIVGNGGYIDQNADCYMEAIPEYLFEFDDYDAAEFEHLSEEAFIELRALLPRNDKLLDLLMHRIYDIAMCYAYTAIPIPPKEAVNLIFDVIGQLKSQNIMIPDFELVSRFNISEFDGWGTHISPEGLSKVV